LVDRGPEKFPQTGIQRHRQRSVSYSEPDGEVMRVEQEARIWQDSVKNPPQKQEAVVTLNHLGERRSTLENIQHG
jgi:hypothetical protein